MKKHAIPSLIAALFALSLASCTPSGSGSFSMSQGDSASNNLRFILNSEGTSYEVSAGKYKLEGDIVIPSTYNGLPVMKVADRGFNNSLITSISLPDSIIWIGESAFEHCHDLAEVRLSSSLAMINDKAFYECRSLKKADVPNSVKIIGQSAFEGCKDLSSLKLCEGLTFISANAFRGCSSLLSLTIPDDMTRIGSFAFDNCTSLKSVSLPSELYQINVGVFARCTSLESFEVREHSIKNLSVKEGILFDEEGTTLISFPSGKDSVYVPDGTLFIGDGAYARADMEVMRIPSSVIAIGEYAFYECDSLKTVNFGNNVSIIQNSAFENCSALEVISLPSSIRTVSKNAFLQCDSLLTVSFPDAPLTIGDYALSKCTSLSNVTMGKSISSIGYNAFSNDSSLVSITYLGTMEDWESVTKGGYWYDKSSLRTVSCTDGDISLNSTN